MPVSTPDVITQICSYQKDDYFINGLRGLMFANAKNIFGNRFVTSWSKEVSILADLLYYGLTTAGSLQTLGEEYTNLIQVDSSMKKVPSLLNRIAMIFLHTLLPFFLEKLLNFLEKQFASNQVAFFSDPVQAKLFETMPKIRLILVTIHRLHLSLFYLNRLYYTIAKRITLIKYVKYFVMPSSNSNSFSFLGKLSLTQAVVMTVIQLYGLYKEIFLASLQSAPFSLARHNPTGLDDGDLDLEKRKCSLCLEVRQHTTITICGHLFCWSCIHEWIQTKAECPLCREELHANQIVVLKNYF